MKNLLALFLILCTFCSLAQDASSFQNDLSGVIQYNSGQVLSLAEAIPEGKYGYAPSEGVHSLSKALLHTASANYFFGMQLGGTIPEGVDPMTMEASITGKANIVEVLKNSYAFIAEAVKGMSDESMTDEIAFPNGQTFSKRMAAMIALGHLSEHKGQLIAYARANEIAPPWSIADKGDTEEKGDGK